MKTIVGGHDELSTVFMRYRQVKVWANEVGTQLRHRSRCNVQQNILMMKLKL